MSDAESLRADYKALNDLIVNCPDFEELERLLGGFNLFQVLKFEYGEIRHSNVLAWILDPSESHGLGESFLKKWLMRVIHEASDTAAPVEPIDIDAWQLLDVEMRREWRNIDLLLILRFAKDAPWVICIENKVNSTQHSDQLSRYRSIVESEFRDVGRRIYFFLTKNSETPDDTQFIPASYAQVHKVLKECLAAREHLIGSEPKALLENYIRLLEEKFMDQSKIAEIARTIYKQHRRALDVLFEHRPDNLLNVSEAIRRMLEEQADVLGIVMAACSKSYIRFVPKEWYQAGNFHGYGWGNCKYTVLFEINLGAKQPGLNVVSGKAPEPWIEDRWKDAQKTPFQMQKKRNERPKDWIVLHCAGKSNLLVGDDQPDDIDIPAEMVKWCAILMKDANTRKVIEHIAATLPDLDAHYRTLTDMKKTKPQANEFRITGDNLGSADAGLHEPLLAQKSAAVMSELLGVQAAVPMGMSIDRAAELFAGPEARSRLAATGALPLGT